MKWSGLMNKLIQELEDGYKGELKVLLTNVNRGVTAKGAPYLTFTLQDKSGSIDAKYWNVSESMLYMFKAGMLVVVTGDVLSHNKQLQFRVQQITAVEGDDYDISEYVKASAIPKSILQEKIMARVSMIQNENIKHLLSELLKDYEKDFYDYPAATKNHHDFVGGLATHVLGMLDIAEHVSNMYPLLNKDILFAGVVLHDLGKLMELSGPIVTEYTVEGKLLGHISIMQANVAEKANQLGIVGEEVTLLRHMILSHHGVYEYGSPVLPLIPEAEILYLIDNIDARMNTIEKAFQNVEEGAFTPRIFALENRCFYKSKLHDEGDKQ